MCFGSQFQRCHSDGVHGCINSASLWGQPHGKSMWIRRLLTSEQIHRNTGSREWGRDQGLLWPSRTYLYCFNSSYYPLPSKVFRAFHTSSAGWEATFQKMWVYWDNLDSHHNRRLTCRVICVSHWCMFSPHTTAFGTLLFSPVQIQILLLRLGP